MKPRQVMRSEALEGHLSSRLLPLSDKWSSKNLISKLHDFEISYPSNSYRLGENQKTRNPMSSITLPNFPAHLLPPNELEDQYPKRYLPPKAMVTRIGPSPTGMMHIGTLYVGLLNSLIAEQSNGVSILRIEDTDKKRELAGATDFILESLEQYKITFDEGMKYNDGDYGPYHQSKRRHIYHTYVNQLVNSNQAYLCFCTPGDLENIRNEQRRTGARSGYYGTWAIWRNKPQVEVDTALMAGIPYVVRFKSPGSHDQKIAFDDLVFGKRETSENDHDIVIMKSDGLPTYHFAHVVDDHLMRTTHVIRGDEWLSSVPTHLQLFSALGWQPPKYAHIVPINKIDGKARRKLSKRKDPEASVEYFSKAGYPEEAILDYLMSLANSNFEAWRSKNLDSALSEFPLALEKLQSGSGPLFDFDKLDNISRETISRFSAETVFDRLASWAREYDPNFAGMMESHSTYTTEILDIERNQLKARKDFTKWSEFKGDISYFYDDWFSLDIEVMLGELSFVSIEELAKITAEFAEHFDVSDGKGVWFDKIKKVAAANNFALKPKDLKTNPTIYNGTVAHVAKIFRVLLTGLPNSPDLYSIMQVMGSERVLARISAFNN